MRRVLVEARAAGVADPEDLARELEDDEPVGLARREEGQVTLPEQGQARERRRREDARAARAGWREDDRGRLGDDPGIELQVVRAEPARIGDDAMRVGGIPKRLPRREMGRVFGVVIAQDEERDLPHGSETALSKIRTKIRRSSAWRSRDR